MVNYILLIWNRTINDVDGELQAFEGLGTAYYYLGELKKSNYYLDRVMRGKYEKSDSKIREIY